MTDWNYDMDAAPKDGTAVLGSWENFIFPVAWKQSPGKPLWGWRVQNWEPVEFLMFVTPVAWMPLPTPPKGQSDA